MNTKGTFSVDFANNVSKQYFIQYSSIILYNTMQKYTLPWEIIEANYEPYQFFCASGSLVSIVL